ncbi:MAG: flavodoxin family protein [Prolixibacteraceae bacterium]
MANILILYYSKEGNTHKMAQYVHEGARELPGNTIRLRSVAEATQDDLLWMDGIAVGSPTHLGLMAFEMKKFWEDQIDLWMKLDGKIACAFSSQGGWGGGAELTCQSINTLLMNFGMLVFGVTDYVAHQHTLHYGAIQAGEPRLNKEIDSCKRLGRRLAEWCAVYVDGKKEVHPLNEVYPRHHERKLKGEI